MFGGKKKEDREIEFEFLQISFSQMVYSKLHRNP